MVANAEVQEGAPAAPPLTRRIGELIGANYRLTRLLGQGGMGDVWLAHNETLDIDVAVKLIRPGASGEAAERLLQEARAAARLEHPAIVHVFDFGRTEVGEPYIVMERLEGEDLATALARHGQITPTKAVRTLLPIVHALAAAHAKGIVHRDLKPENVFLVKVEGERLQPKIVDFGIAKIEQSEVKLTQAGEVLGSPTYMSPEQARGDEVDYRADIWSVCVVLYELVSGKKPFTRDNYNATLHAILTGDPEPLSVSSAADVPLAEILAKGLSKSPDDRFPTMRALGEALSHWLLSQGVTEDIAGATLESAWSQRTSSATGDALMSLSPAGDEQSDRVSEESGITTSRLRVVSHPARNPLVIVAVAMTAAGLGGGLLVGKWLRGPEPARHAATPSTAAARPPAPLARHSPALPRADRDDSHKIAPARPPEVDPAPSASDGTFNATSSKALTSGTPTRPHWSGHMRKPTLKDPFQ